MTIGRDGLGDYARYQLDKAETDPRMERPEGAYVVEFFDYVHEADRVRLLHSIGLRETMKSLEREEQDLGVTRDNPDLTAGQRSSLQMAWERAEMARLEVSSGSPHMNGITLVGLFGNLDNYVEKLSPSLRAATEEAVGTHFDKLLNELRARNSEARALLAEHPGVAQNLRALLLEKAMGGAPATSPFGNPGSQRWENILRTAGLAAPAGSIPQEMEHALKEFGVLRHVLVHRGGRVDRKAMRNSEGLLAALGYSEGGFVRIGLEDFRRYYAALFVYGMDVTRRVNAKIGLPFRSFRIADWDAYCPSGL